MAGDTFLFADIVGFTSFTERYGDEEAANLAARLRAGVEASLPEGAQLVKTMGDAVMVRLEDPAEAATTAVRIARSALGPGDPPVRVGVHTGSAVERDGDFYGATVNIAARLAAFAQPGEVLVTREFAAATRAFAPVLAVWEEPALKPIEGVAA